MTWLRPVLYRSSTPSVPLRLKGLIFIGLCLWYFMLIQVPEMCFDPSGLGGNVGCDLVVRRRGRSGRGVVVGLFEAASPGQSKELGNQRGSSRLRSCSLITVSSTQPLCCLFLQPWPITAWPHGNSNMETYQGLSFSLPLWHTAG